MNPNKKNRIRYFGPVLFHSAVCPGIQSLRSSLSRLRSSSPAMAKRHMKKTPSIPPMNSPPINDSQCMIVALLPIRTDPEKSMPKRAGIMRSESKKAARMRSNRFLSETPCPAAIEVSFIRFPGYLRFPRAGRRFCSPLPDAASRAISRRRARRSLPYDRADRSAP